ncbi:MAG TPA: ATP-binding cassette domain-containing protein [Acidimicrobiales bacterium]|nr:ATP-binding cassette domain-containing protein [Acidimicrobiales bacterium]
MNAIEVVGLTAGHGGVPAVRDLHIQVGAGEVVALLGPTGAGKSTTIRAVSGLTGVLGGSVHLFGADVTSTSVRTRVRCGLATVAEDRGVFTQLTVAENLRLGARRPRADLPLDDWFPSLVPLLRRRAGLLSGGEQTLLALARAIRSRPAALLVDELTIGLAAGWVGAARNALRRASAEWGTGVLLAEPRALVALDTADRAYLLGRGQVVFEGPTADLARRPDLLESTYFGDLAGTEVPPK